MHTWKSKYKVGQTLYVKNDKEQLPRHCISVNFMPFGVGYELKHPQSGVEFYYEFEVQTDMDVEMKYVNN